MIRSVSNHVVSLVDTEKEKSFILTHQQTVKPEVKPVKKWKPSKRRKKHKKAKGSSTVKKTKGKAGRAKGSKNKQNVKHTGLLYESLTSLSTWLTLSFI